MGNHALVGLGHGLSLAGVSHERSQQEVDESTRVTNKVRIVKPKMLKALSPEAHRDYTALRHAFLLLSMLQAAPFTK